MDLAIAGHEGVLAELATLKGHTFLFVGPDGVGRRRCGRWLAALRNCQQPAGRPCGRCASCRLISDGAHPDYRELLPDTQTATGRMARRQEIRIGRLVPRPGDDPDPLSRWLEQRPRFGQRVAVIDGAHTLTRGAANAFLKMLEEPPTYACIVLIAPSVGSVLPTIASRSLVVRFGPADTSSYDDLPAHPGHLLGRIGPLEQARRDRTGYEEAAQAVDRFLEVLDQDLERVLEAAEVLEKTWLNLPEQELPLHLRAAFRALPGALLVPAEEALERCEEALQHYAPAGLAFQRLALELRRHLPRTRRDGVADDT